MENSTGSNNTAFGHRAGRNLSTGHANVFIGYETYASAGNVQNEVVIGYALTGAGTNTVSIGNTNVTAIKGQVAFSTYSDERIKRNIDDSKLGLNFIMKLRPVTYKMKNPADYPNELLEARFRDVPCI